MFIQGGEVGHLEREEGEKTENIGRKRKKRNGTLEVTTKKKKKHNRGEGRTKKKKLPVRLSRIE